MVARRRVDPASHRHLDFALQHEGKVLFELGRHAEALVALREALTLRVAKAGAALVASTALAIDVVETTARAARERS